MAIVGNLGIVAIGRNEGQRLERCLSSIPSDIPVVYVDSGSTDSSIAFARSRGAEIVELDLASPFTAARARNAGFAKLLRSWPELDLVQFIDGDCEIEQGWLLAAEHFMMSEPAAAAVCGRRRERYPDRSFYNRLCDEEWNTSIGEARACGGDAMLRVAAMQAVGGYDPTMIAGEEPEFCHRLRAAGWTIWRIDAPMTIHDADMHHTRQWWLRAVCSGFGYAQAWQKTKRFKPGGLYSRQIASALFWTFGVALAGAGMAILFGPIGLLAAPLLWTAQLLRLSMRGGLRKAAHILAGKLAETAGILRYAVSVLRGERPGAIFYK